MKNLVLLLALVPFVAMGRLGETAAECAKRYGTPRKLENGDKNSAYFLKNGFRIEVHLFQDRCVALHYSKPSGKMTITEMIAIYLKLPIDEDSIEILGDCCYTIQGKYNLRDSIDPSKIRKRDFEVAVNQEEGTLTIVDQALYLLAEGIREQNSTNDF